MLSIQETNEGYTETLYYILQLLMALYLKTKLFFIKVNKAEKKYLQYKKGKKSNPWYVKSLTN